MQNESVEKSQSENLIQLGKQKLAQKIHNTARSKGWWDKPRSPQELLVLVITEIAEAVEEVRKGTPAVYWDTPTGRVSFADLGGSMKLFVGEQLAKPEGELIEIADAAIRLMDMGGSLPGFNLDELLSALKEENPDASTDEMKFYYDVCHVLTHLDMPNNFKIAVCIRGMEIYCRNKGFDLWKAVESKMEYNETRSHRHGGKKF